MTTDELTLATAPVKCRSAGPVEAGQQPRPPQEPQQTVPPRVLEVSFTAERRSLLDTAAAMDTTTDEDARLALRWKGFAYWHAVGHLFAKSDADSVLKDVFFTGKITKDFAASVQKAVGDNLGALGMTKEDFGTALP